MSAQKNRCGIVLNLNPQSAGEAVVAEVANSGIISSCILYRGDSVESEFEDYCQRLVPLLQQQDVATLIADDTRLVGRSGADGIFLEKNRKEVSEMVDRYCPDQIVGCGGFKNRHIALAIGEAKPDFVFFGKLGGDIRDEAHPKNLALSKWWSEIVEIPSVVMAGRTLDSIVECAQTGADFVAVEAYVFSQDLKAANAIERAEEQLELHAPRFEEVLT